MKRVLVLILVLAFAFALFAGCGGNTTGTTAGTTEQQSGGSTAGTTEQQSGGSTAGTTEQQSGGSTAGTTEQQSGGAETTEPAGGETAEELPFAAGKYKADANGLALEKYDYPLPLTTSDEVISIWTSCYTPEYLEEEGYDSMPFAQEVFNRTGVHTEHVMAPSTSRAENFSVLLASDDLMDIMTQPQSFYGGPIEKAIEEEGYFVNLYDYRMYMPNYVYEVTKDPEDRNTIHKAFLRDDLWAVMYELRAVKELSSGAFARGDWLYKMGKTNKDIKTFDDYHDMFTFFKTMDTCEYPATLLKTLELAGAYEWVGYDTYCCCSVTSTQVVKDGKVYLSNLQENDKELMQLLVDWYKEGLLDPNWTSYANIPDIGDRITTGKLGYIAGTRATTMKSNDSAIPEDAPVGWVAMTKPQRYEGQTLHLGFQTDRIYWGSAGISAKCENIPLAVTWLDWRYSEEGSFLYGYGVEGVSWEYDDAGNVVITDFITSHPGGWTMIMLTYALNSICEPGLYINYAWNAPGNEVAFQYTQDWEDVPHDDLYVYPSGISYNDEQNEKIASISADLSTYLEENYLSFVDGSKPMSDWDEYVEGAKAVGSEELAAVYQEAYDAFMNS